MHAIIYKVSPPFIGGVKSAVRIKYFAEIYIPLRVCVKKPGRGEEKDDKRRGYTADKRFKKEVRQLNQYKICKL
jgi:hypothetical protein